MKLYIATQSLLLQNSVSKWFCTLDHFLQYHFSGLRESFDSCTIFCFIMKYTDGHPFLIYRTGPPCYLGCWWDFPFSSYLCVRRKGQVIHSLTMTAAWTFQLYYRCLYICCCIGFGIKYSNQEHVWGRISGGYCLSSFMYQLLTMRSFHDKLFASDLYDALNPRWASTLLGCIAVLMVPIPLVLKR